MRIDVKKNKQTNKFILFVNEEEIIESEKLSDITGKIEDWLILRFLKEDPRKKGGISGFFSKITAGFQGE